MAPVAAGDIADGSVHMVGTTGMLKHVAEHAGGEFIVATETGMLHPLAGRRRLTESCDASAVRPTSSASSELSSSSANVSGARFAA